MPNIKVFTLPLRNGPHDTHLSCIDLALYNAMGFKTHGLTVTLLSLTTLPLGNVMDLTINSDIIDKWFLVFLFYLDMFNISSGQISVCCAYFRNTGDLMACPSYILE